MSNKQKKETEKKSLNKKNKQKVEETQNNKQENKLKDSNNELAKLLKIVLIVVGVMIIFYGVTLVVTNQADKTLSQQETETQPQETTIQYENIIIGSMLSQNGTYYVLIENEDDNRITEYESIISTIKSSEDAPTIYKANLTDSFNKKYLGKEQNYYVDDISEFKVTSTVLVKVKDGRIDTVNDTYDSIKNKLKDLV